MLIFPDIGLFDDSLSGDFFIDGFSFVIISSMFISSLNCDIVKFDEEKMSFQNDNDMNYNLEKDNIEVMVKNVDAILNSLEKQIDNLKIYNTELKHINILYHLNEIYENGNININQRMKCLKLKEKLVDKLINWVNRKISNF